MKRIVLLSLAIAAAAAASAQTPLASGKGKFLGSAHSSTQTTGFTQYFNQVTPENGGKWGTVEATRDVMQWGQMDAAYQLARQNGLPFKIHTLIWGSQQPAWITALPAAEQLQEIEEWYAALAVRYPDAEMIDVVNEPINSPPNGTTNFGTTMANYVQALGGTGTTGWDWVIKSFEMARQYFPNSKLLLNEYSITNTASRMQTYVQIVNLLKARGLIDGVGVQAHAFSTAGIPVATTKANLDTLAATGVPIYVTELDIDSNGSDTVQLDEYKRVFPVFWEHPGVKGVTLWGYRPGLWRDQQGAYLIRADNTEKPAMEWLKQYLAAQPAGGPIIWRNPAGQSAYVGGSATLRVVATDVTGYQWTKNGAAIAGANSATLTLSNLQPGDTGDYAVITSNAGGTTTSAAARISVADPSDAGRIINLSARAYADKDRPLTIGTVIALNGGSRKALVVRAQGPNIAAAPFNVTDAMPDPTIKLMGRGNTVLATNDNWASDPAQVEQMGIFKFGNPASKDAAVVKDLELVPGSSDFIAEVVPAGTTAGGIAVAEFNDLTSVFTENTPKLINISVRADARPGNGLLILGFTIQGSTRVRVMVRAIGPSLSRAPWNVLGINLLPDPFMELHTADAQGRDVVITTNNNWSEASNASAIATATNAQFPHAALTSGSKDAVILIDLDPGSYTATVRDVNNATGNCLLELNVVP